MPKTVSEDEILSEIKAQYRGYGRHYTDIVKEMSGRLFSWIFILNTGGVAVVAPYLIYKNNPLLFIPIIIFAIGIILIFCAVKCEHIRFANKGAKLDELFYDLFRGHIALEHYRKSIPPKVDFYDKATPFLENLSLVFFLLGLISGIGLSLVITS